MDDLFGQVTDHRCLACGQIHKGAQDVTLVDGTVVSNYSEAWRQECEARATLNIPGLHARQARLEFIERKRGKAVADALRATMLAVWNAAKKNDAA